MVRSGLRRVRSPKSRVGRIAAAGSSMSGSIENRRLPRRRSTASPRSMSSRPRPHSPLPPSGWQLRTQTAPLLEAFFAWAEATVAKLSAKSALATAFRYAINRREALSRFVTDGRLEVDNNIAENGMRIIALGRKNFLFAGSDTGGDRAAAIYTIVQTAKLNGVNPEAYLKDTLAKIAEGHPINKVDQLMPWQMNSPAAAQPE